TTLRVTIPAGPGGFLLDPASVTDLGDEFSIIDTDPDRPGVQIGDDPNGTWTIALDPNRDPIRIGDTNDFDFPIIITLPDDLNPNPSVRARIMFNENAWAYMGPTEGGTQPGDTVRLSGMAQTNSRTFIDVTFRPSAGRELDSDSILDPDDEFTLGGIGGASVAFSSDELAVLDLGGGVFRYLLEGDFQPGPVEVAFIANEWKDAVRAGGPMDADEPTEPYSNRAFTQGFLVQGTSGDLV